MQIPGAAAAIPGAKPREEPRSAHGGESINAQSAAAERQLRAGSQRCDLRCRRETGALIAILVYHPSAIDPQTESRAQHTEAGESRRDVAGAAELPLRLCDGEIEAEAAVLALVHLAQGRTLAEEGRRRDDRQAQHRHADPPHIPIL